MAAVKPIATRQTTSAPPTNRSWPFVAALLLAVVAVYWNSLGAPFLFDDTGAVLNNPTIRDLASPAVLLPPSDGSTTTGRPIINLSLAINFAISGEQVWSYHALNIAIHALAALTLMGIVRRTLGTAALNKHFGASAQPLAFFIALLWAVHPLLTESVVCVAQRTESLCGLFYLLTLYAFIRGAGNGAPRRGWLALSVLACLTGMATKEVMVTAPVVVLLYDRTFLAGDFLAALRQRRAYYAAIAGTWLLLGWLWFATGGSRGIAAGFGLGVSPWSYLLTQSDALVTYLRLSFWPHPLVLDYGTSVAHAITEVWWQGLVVLALLAGTIWALVRKPIAGFAGATFFVILAPSSSVVPLVTQTVAEHRMYLPLALVTAAVVLLAYTWIRARAFWILGAAAVAFAGLTIARNHDYRDAVSIWSDTLAKSPENPRAHNNLASALQQRGESARANEHFARAVELKPDYVVAHLSWGVALLEQGRFDDAIAQLRAAVKLAPDYAEAHLHLGNALMQTGRVAEAIASYEEALRIQPSPDIHYNLGFACATAGRNEEAKRHFHAALQTMPGLAEAHFQLAQIAEKEDRMADAEREYTETLRFAPDHVLAHRQLGLLLARSERFSAAAVHFEAVARLQPTDADAHGNLGNIFLIQKRPREAIAQFEEALRLRPNDARFREMLQLARQASSH